MSTELPTVSIIVPIYNGEHDLPDLLAALRAQDYPADRMEVLLVDNRSTDCTAELIRQSGFRGLSEESAQSSYAARNRGIAAATGEILAFTDADCRPDPSWLREGVRALEENGADLAGGRVETRLGEKANVYELYNVFMEPPQDKFVEKGTAITGNLFVRRRVMAELGGFESGMISCGDLLLTSRAVESGHRLVLAERCVVGHAPRRTARSLFRKGWRLGFGLVQHDYVRHGRPGEGMSHGSWLCYVPAIIPYVIFVRRYRLGLVDRVRAFFLFWGVSVAMAFGSRAAVRHHRRGLTELPVHG